MMIRTVHVCSLPVWEYDYYWQVLQVFTERGMIDLADLPRELENIELAKIKQVLLYEELHEKAEAINTHSWRIKK